MLQDGEAIDWDDLEGSHHEPRENGFVAHDVEGKQEEPEPTNDDNTKTTTAEAPVREDQPAAAGPSEEVPRSLKQEQAIPVNQESSIHREVKKNAFLEYLKKFTGKPGSRPMAIGRPLFILISFLGSFVSVLVVSCIAFLPLEETDYTMLVASFGATAVLLFGAPESPLSQPRNAFFGQVIGCAIGIGCRMWIGDPMGTQVLACPISIALTLFLMHVTSTIHPPAGGTTLIAVTGSAKVIALGWGFLVPVILSSAIFIFVAVIFNNIHQNIRYPHYWFIDWSSLWKKKKEQPTSS